MWLAWILSASAARSLAWDFPRAGLGLNRGAQGPLSLDDNENIDIVSGSQFNGLKTFANLPYLNCFSDEETRDSKYDIAVIGAPFDTVRWRLQGLQEYKLTDGIYPVGHRATRSSLRPDRYQDREPTDTTIMECLHWLALLPRLGCRPTVSRRPGREKRSWFLGKHRGLR